LKEGGEIVLPGDALRQEMQSIAAKVLQLSAYLYSHRVNEILTLANIEFHASWAQDVLAVIEESQESWNEIPHYIVLRFLTESARAAAPYGFEATFNMITTLPPVDRNWSTAVKRSSKGLFTELVDVNIEYGRRDGRG
jgi:hypothetical protein